MRSLPLVLVGFSFAFGGALFAQDLGSKDKAALVKIYEKWIAESDADQKEDLAYGLAGFGKPGIEHLLTLRPKKGQEAAQQELKDAAPKLLGADLLEGRTPKNKATWFPVLLAEKEIAVAGKDEDLVAFRVLDTPDSATGNIQVETWKQKGKGRSFGAGEHASVPVEGRKVTKSWRPNSGYDEREFEIDLGNGKLGLRFVGPAHYLLRSDPAQALAMPGVQSIDGLKVGAIKTRFYAGVPETFGLVDERLQAYLFRVFPGCKPLLVSEAEAASFAQYESVQVQTRFDRPDGAPFVLVRIAEPENAGVTENRAAAAWGFTRTLLPIPRDRLIIAGGSGATIDGCRFFRNGQWEACWPELSAFLRKNFPEDS